MEYDYDEKLMAMLSGNIAKVRDDISSAAKASGRDPDSVTLVGVSKVFPVSYAEAAFKAGITDLGENKVQELVPKYERMNELDLHPNWHLIGTLQTNKVKYIIGKTHLIHSVDSLKLAQEIGKRSVSEGITTDILIQVNVSGEESKHGFSPDEIIASAEALNSVKGIRMRGLMTMAPIEQFEGQAREVFSNTRMLFEKLRSDMGDKENWNILSMGMSHDYKDAIREGATHIRIGTSIFGDRSAYLSV